MEALIPTLTGTFEHLTWYLRRLDAEVYARPLELFSGSSLGQHTRHILEFFQCLMQQQATGIINYEQRCRNRDLEQQPEVALAVLAEIQAHLRAPGLQQSLVLETVYDHDRPPVQVPTTLARELIYNIEHTIHHLAMIRIGLRALYPDWELPEGFGIAPSTLHHRQQAEA